MPAATRWVAMEVRFELMIQIIKYCFICCCVAWGPDLLGARWAYKYFKCKINLNISLTIINPNFRENAIFWMPEGGGGEHPGIYK